MTNLGNFEPRENTGFEPLPAGKYLAAIIEDELRDNSKGTGQHLHLAWQILKGPFTGRQVFQNVNVKNNNPTAEEIGTKEIAQICHAIGHSGANVDSRDFHGKPCLISLIIMKDDGYDPSNEIKRVERVPAATVSSQPPPGATAPNLGATAAGNGNAPWR